MGFEVVPPNENRENKLKSFRRRDSQELAFSPGEKPHDLDTERAVLAGAFLSGEAFSDLQQVVKAEDFYLPAHKTLFQSMVRLSMKGVPIDITTVAGALRDDGKLEEIGGQSYLGQIIMIPATSMHSKEYGKIVADLAWRRRILAAAEVAREKALSPGDTRSLAAEIEKNFFAVTQEKKDSRLVRIGDLLDPALRELEKRADNQGVVSNAILTGLRDLDEKVSGFRPGQLVVLAAGPGTGKTSLAANLMYYAAVKQRKNVLFFSLEMTQEEVVERILSFASGIDATRIRSGQLSAKDFTDLFYAADDIGQAPLYIDDRSVVSPYDILAQARKLTASINMAHPGQQVDLIVADYIQIMKSGGYNENRALEVAAITGGLKAIAKEMRVPVLALSQLNRDRSKRTGTDARPQLSDLKDSGAIEADADVVLFIHRDMGPETDSRAPAKAEIIVAKQRSGPTGSVPVTWLGNLTRFTDYIEGPQDGPPHISYGSQEPDVGL